MLGFLGGTGVEGRGLALRFALAGNKVLIGSRDRERANVAAQKVLDLAEGLWVHGADNAEVAREADIVFIVVPYDAQVALLRDVGVYLRGKTVVNAVIPLVFVDGQVRIIPVEDGSAASQAQTLLSESKVVAGFHSLSAKDLLNPKRVINGDVLVCSDFSDAKKQVMDLALSIKGVRPVDGGGLINAGYVENMTAVLLTINHTYKGRAMFRITGIPALEETFPSSSSS